MADPSEILVLVVEDDRRIRQGLELLIDGTVGIMCAGSYGDAETLLDEKIGPEIDVILLDIGLPGRSGVEAIPSIRARWPRADVIMLTVHDDKDLIFQALCHGASGYLLKNTSPAEILNAIRDVREGGAPMTPSIARKVIRFFRRPAIRAEGLSDRERDVLEQLMQGKSNRQIADSLFISSNTVAYHLKQIYEKLHVHSRAEAVAKAVQNRS